MNITFTATRQNQTFRTTLAGVTYPNLDGTNRQIILKSIRPGEQLRLERDSTNPHDKHAVAVFRSSGVQLGFIPAGDARLANHIDGGGAASARVVSLIGGPGFFRLSFQVISEELWMLD